ncbi:MAG TPA: hypothetical protein VMK65_05950 [Longimicrobiales bacterium]|nr:hypothetical protein [Longimicrobiales bacterium]
MRKIALGVASLLLASCASTAEVRSVESWSGRIAAEEFDDLRAAASVNSGMYETAASVSIAGASANATIPWHVHVGRCGSGGAIVGNAAAYSPISVGSNGEGRASARVNVALASGGQYHVNFHQSPSNLGTIIGCLNLSR